MSKSDKYYDFLIERRQAILDRAAAAAHKSGRSLPEIDIVCVSKTVDTDSVVAAHDIGWKHFAENRPQELDKKLSELEAMGIKDEFVFDMIGNLQTNKINQVLASSPRLIHSVDALKLAENISKRALRDEVVAPVLLQVNTSGEESKSGFSPKEIKACFEDLLDLEGLDVLGLMTMAPKDNKSAARKCFRDTRKLQDQLIDEYEWELPIMSAGMSGDFEIAIEEGSNLVRLGRVVFDNEYNLI